MPRMRAKMIHPIRSLKIAAATMIIPRSVLKILISMRILATTGRAEIERAVAKKSEKISGSAPGSLPRSFGATQAEQKPIKKGTAMPVIPTVRAERPWRQTVERSTFIPDTRRKRAMASVVRLSIPTATGPPLGNRLALTSGAKNPRTVGPRRIPARISPSTAGW